nr:uncharacterized protein LOC120095581 [Rattus norvegicus]
MVFHYSRYSDCCFDWCPVSCSPVCQCKTQAEIQYIYCANSSYLSIKESKINTAQTSPEVIKQHSSKPRIGAPFTLSGIEISTAGMTCDFSLLLPTVPISALLNSMMSQPFNFFPSTPKVLLCASNCVIDSTVAAIAGTSFTMYSLALYLAIVLNKNPTVQFSQRLVKKSVWMTKPFTSSEILNYGLIKFPRKKRHSLYRPI